MESDLPKKIDFGKYILGRPPSPRSKRADTIKELYDLYTLPEERAARRKENWRRYIRHLKDNKLKDSEEVRAKFKTSRRFVREIKINSFAYLLSHLKQADLYYLLSVCKDMKRCEKIVGGYLISSVLGDKIKEP